MTTVEVGGEEAVTIGVEVEELEIIGIVVLAAPASVEEGVVFTRGGGGGSTSSVELAVVMCWSKVLSVRGSSAWVRTGKLTNEMLKSIANRGL